MREQPNDIWSGPELYIYSLGCLMLKEQDLMSIVKLREDKGLTFREIAGRLHIPQRTVEYRYYRAKAKENISLRFSENLRETLRIADNDAVEKSQTISEKRRESQSLLNSYLSNIGRNNQANQVEEIKKPPGEVIKSPADKKTDILNFVKHKKEQDSQKGFAVSWVLVGVALAVVVVFVIALLEYRKKQKENSQGSNGNPGNIPGRGWAKRQ